MKQNLLIFSLFACLCMSCNTKSDQPVSEYIPKDVQIVTLDPGHFHAALVQKTVYENVDSTVYVLCARGK